MNIELVNLVHNPGSGLRLWINQSDIILKKGGYIWYLKIIWRCKKNLSFSIVWQERKKSVKSCFKLSFFLNKRNENQDKLYIFK